MKSAFHVCIAVSCGPHHSSDDVVFSFQTELMNDANLLQLHAIATAISSPFTFHGIVIIINY